MRVDVVSRTSLTTVFLEMEPARGERGREPEQLSRWERERKDERKEKMKVNCSAG